MQEYNIVAAEDIEKLIKHVNFFLRDNWITQGGIYIYKGIYLQAIVKQVDDE